MRVIQELVRLYNLDRPTMSQADENPEHQKKLLLDEVKEAFEVMDDPDKLRTELADILWYVSVIANLHEIDLEAEVREKAARNILKYPPSMFQGGDYQLARDSAKRIWVETGGEERFYDKPPVLSIPDQAES